MSDVILLNLDRDSYDENAKKKRAYRCMFIVDSSTQNYSKQLNSAAQMEKYKDQNTLVGILAALQLEKLKVRNVNHCCGPIATQPRQTFVELFLDVLLTASDSSMSFRSMFFFQEETMAKLKDLGNSLLGNFGLSLDNFGTVQDPSTGSYSISFNQNK